MNTHIYIENELHKYMKCFDCKPQCRIYSFRGYATLVSLFEFYSQQQVMHDYMTLWARVLFAINMLTRDKCAFKMQI